MDETKIKEATTEEIERILPNFKEKLDPRSDEDIIYELKKWINLWWGEKDREKKNAYIIIYTKAFCDLTEDMPKEKIIEIRNTLYEYAINKYPEKINQTI